MEADLQQRVFGMPVVVLPGPPEGEPEPRAMLVMRQDNGDVVVAVAGREPVTVPRETWDEWLREGWAQAWRKVMGGTDG